MTDQETARSCGECSLCCTVLRVDELEKLGGVPCKALRRASEGGGCGIHEHRPQICRGYRCLWLQGGLEETDRPDRLGALLDLVTAGAATRLEIHEAEPGAFERSPRLREIADQHRAAMPVRILDVGDVLDPDRPYRILLPGGDEQRVRGEYTTEVSDGRVTAERRLPWIERSLRRLVIRWRRRRFRRFSRNGPRN